MGEGWVEEELATLDLGDARRNRRCKQTLRTLSEKPQASIPEASKNEAEIQGIYGFLSAETTEPEAIRRAHAEAVARRIEECGEVLIVNDTTELAFNTLREAEGLGPLSGSYSRGLMMHSALVIDLEGVPQGLLHQEVWARSEEEVGKRHSRRQRLIEEKESQKWLTTVRVCGERLPESVNAWVVGDSESDIYELMAMPRREGVDLLIRATHDRRVDVLGKISSLRATVEAAPVMARKIVTLKRTRARQERTATLEVRLSPSVQILRPKHKTKNTPVKAVSVSVVLVREVGEVPPGEKAVEWLLVSTRLLESGEAAQGAVDAYTQRWLVERFHYTAKSGCQVEKLQLEHADRIERAVALYSIVAWRQLHITYLARRSPEHPCTVALEEVEWKVLHQMTNPGRALPDQPPTLRIAMRQIAHLGGFLGRKGDGEPGVKVIWRGLRRLADFVLAFQAFSGAKL